MYIAARISVLSYVNFSNLWPADYGLWKIREKNAKKFGIPGEVKYLSGVNIKGICWDSEYRYTFAGALTEKNITQNHYKLRLPKDYKHYHRG